MMFRLLSVAAITFCLTNPLTSAEEPASKNPSVHDNPMASIIIASSQSGKTLYGYSVVTGAWDAVTVSNPANSRLVPVVAGTLGYVKVDKTIYAFCATIGRWAPLELTAAAEPILLYSARIRVDVGTKVHIYSPVTGTWAMIDMALEK